jgi:2-polyprenyl-3-methyl-5-hydroxy-6-metoxy-1,4-benzoquinol methylase
MLISEEHRSNETKKHIADPDYGGECIQYAEHISTMVNAMQIDDVLDYGAGKGELHRHLALDHEIALHLYDPAIKQIADSPEPHDLVLCINVLEHVEEECLEDVMNDLARCAKHNIFLVIKEDMPMEWWLPHVMKRFRIESLVRSDIDFFLIASKKNGN